MQAEPNRPYRTSWRGPSQVSGVDYPLLRAPSLSGQEGSASLPRILRCGRRIEYSCVFGELCHWRPKGQQISAYFGQFCYVQWQVAALMTFGTAGCRKWSFGIGLRRRQHMAQICPIDVAGMIGLTIRE
jgi:hypothetical protein